VRNYNTLGLSCEFDNGRMKKVKIGGRNKLQKERKRKT